MAKLTKRLIDGASPSGKDYFIWDDELAGFGLRILPSGIKSYVIQYRIGGRTRRHAFSRTGTMTQDEARKHARELLVAVDQGKDPVAEIVAHRRSPNIAALCLRFMAEHVAHRCKPSTQREYQRSIDLFINPKLGTFNILDVKRGDIAKLHGEMSQIPYQANRTLGVLSKLFNFAEILELRPDGSNPCRHVRKYPESKRERYLTAEELHRLGQVLDNAQRDGSEPLPVIWAIRLLILTGCRLGEIQTLKWEHVHSAYLALPDSKTGAKRVVLSDAAADTLLQIDRVSGNPYVVTGTLHGQHWTDLQRPWRRIRDKAGLPDVRIHDLRHSFASMAVNSGETLPTIGKLLGHSNPATTARYTHFAPNPLKAAVDRVAVQISNAMAGKSAQSTLPTIPELKFAAE